ncbi:MAG: 30S ribosome-binding factor RbfA [Planctomycetota bacterium]
MNRRRQQLESTIERTVQQVLARGLADPRVKGLITVTSAELNDELRTVTINVSILPEEHESLTMHGLKAATTHVRKEVMSRIRTREMPRLEFRLDRTVKQQAELLSLINKASEDAPEESDPRAEPGADSGVSSDDAAPRAANDDSAGPSGPAPEHAT